VFDIREEDCPIGVEQAYVYLTAQIVVDDPGRRGKTLSEFVGRSTWSTGYTLGSRGALRTGSGYGEFRYLLFYLYTIVDRHRVTAL
jgi:hypothetical protein